MKNTCCFFGHRKIRYTSELRERLYVIIENLIKNQNIHVFLFGSKSEFNSLCYDIVSDIKEKYPHIKRIYVRAEYPYVDDSYKKYLLNNYEETYYPENILSVTKSIYIKRNFHMIDRSRICVVYFNTEYEHPENHGSRRQTNSGTKIAYKYAVKIGKDIINIFE